MGEVQTRRRSRRARLAAIGFAAVLVPLTGGRADAGVAVALTDDNRLLRFDTARPGTIDKTTAVSGLAASEDLLGIDFRPGPAGGLYGLGSLGQVYRVDAVTGAATAVGSPLDAAAVPLAGSRYGFDFNPVVDRVRVVSDLGENLRLNPNNGALGAVDGELKYKAGDPNAGELGTVAAVAYTNSFAGRAAPATTTLYGIDSDLGVLVTVAPPNDGTLNTIGSLGLSSLPLFGGFDILGEREAFAATTSEPAFGSLGELDATLYSINLDTGAATSLGQIGDGSFNIVGLTTADNVAAVPLPPAVLAAPFVLVGIGLYQRRVKRLALAQA